MKHRAVEILMDIMRSADGKVFTGQLMDMYGIGDRTLKNDLKHINAYLISLNQAPLRIASEGRILLPPNTDRTFILESLGRQALTMYIMLPQEREIMQFVMLLNASGYVTIGEIAKKMEISQVTAINDVSRLKEQFLTQGVYIKSSPGKGIRLVYTERSVRHVLISLLARMIDQFDGNYSVFQNLILHQLNFIHPLGWFWSKVKLYDVQLRLNLLEDDVKIAALYFFVSMNRCLGGHPILEEESGDKDGLDKRKLKKLYQLIANELGLETREGELAVLCNDAKLFPFCIPQEENPYLYQKIKMRVIDFIGNISRQLEVALYSDEVLLELLIQYFMNERKMNERLDPALINQMKADYPHIYRAVLECLDSLTDEIRCDDYEEITYIVMYLIAAMDRVGPAEKKLSVLIACPGGVAVGQLLASKVRRIFNFHIIGICSANSLYYDERMKRADFVISAINIAKSDRPVIVVDPLLSREDIINIYELSYMILSEKRAEGFVEDRLDREMTRLQKIVQENQCSPERKDIEAAVRLLNEKFSVRESGAARLKQLFLPEFVQKTKGCTDWEDALRIAAGPLIRCQRISRGYIDATVENCKLNGPYFILREGFCIAHALPEKGLIEPCLGLLYIEEGVDFGHEFFGPVHMLFYTCFRESSQWNLKILRTLISIAENSDLCGKISAKDGHGIYEIILEVLTDGLDGE